MLHHISFSVSDLKRSAGFYDSILGPLGYRRVCEGNDFVGYGTEEYKDKFALKSRVDNVNKPSVGFHLAFAAPDRNSIDEAYNEGIQNGGTDNGKPGLREHYGPSYYAAFLIDPDGYEVELVINSNEVDI
ncbi:MAG: VOC family protein [Roseibium sp.]